MNINPKQAEGFYIRLNSAFAFIFILVVVASGFGIYTLYNLGQVINTTEKETFPATLAAMRLSERTALIAASAPALTAASNENDINNIYFEFERHMSQNLSDLQSVYKMGDPQTLTAVKENLDRVSIIEASLRNMVQEKLDLSKTRHVILENLLKLQADLDDTLVPLVWGTTSLTKLLGKRTVRMATQNIGDDIGQLRESLNEFTETAIKPLETAFDIKAESALLMSLLNMAMHVGSPDDIFPLENRANRSLNLFFMASAEFHKGELSKRNPVLNVNLNRIEQNLTALIKGEINPFDIRRKEIEQDLAILSLLNQGRQAAKTLSQQIEIIVRQVQQNLHHQAELVRKSKLTGVTVLGMISLVSCFLSIIVAVLTTRALLNRDNAIQKAVIEAERANKIKSQFLANMSHEIRTPMNSILGFLDLVLEDDTLKLQQRQHLATAHGSAQGLLSLINDILDMNKFESGKVIIEHEQFGFTRLIQQIFDIMEIKAKEKGIELNYQIHESLYRVFSGDALRIRQVIINLLANSIKFTHTGSVTLTIMPKSDQVIPEGDDLISDMVGDTIVSDDSNDKNYPADSKSVMVHFTIEDTGIGIASDRLDHIFDPFTQADSSTTRKYGGTGLGTTISKQIVELMGGQIWVESEEDKGSKFHFTIPLSIVDDPLMLTTDISSDVDKSAYYDKTSNSYKTFKERLHTKRGSGRSFKILVAEDVEANALLVKTRLKLQGHTVTLAKNGAEAVKAFQDEKFDIVLMDVHMPEMDGLEATRMIRSIEEERGYLYSDGDIPVDSSRHIPIIALTASIMQDEIKKFIATGMDDFVGKPIDFNELVRTMDKYIQSLDNQDEYENHHNQEHYNERRRSKLVESQGLLKVSEDYGISKDLIISICEDVNFEEGLKRWQDISVYIGALKHFTDDYGDIVATISTLVNCDANPDMAQIEEAYKITHALKGVAANLSISKVAATAVKINSALQRYKMGGQSKEVEDGGENSFNTQYGEGDFNLQDARNNLKLLSTFMRIALDVIDTLYVIHSASSKLLEQQHYQEEKVALKEKEVSSTTINMDEINEIIGKLHECIEQYSPDGIEPLIKRLEQYILPEYLKPIRKYVDDFDFGTAGNELSQLSTRLKNS